MTTFMAPQEGPQTQFLGNPADLVVYGGAAGGGKSWGLLFEPLRHINNPHFNGVIFRRTFKQIKNQGGLWDAALEMYTPLGGKSNQQDMSFSFPSGAKIQFSHLQHEKNKLDWQGSEIDFSGWDELTHFTEGQFFYLFSRMRNPHSMIDGYVRASTNPDAASWVKRLIAPWVDEEWREEEEELAGLEDRTPRLPVSNQVLWFRRNENGDTGESDFEFRLPEELSEEERGTDSEWSTLSFVASSVTDNQILMDQDPTYIKNLKKLGYVDRKRLLEGDWDVSEGDSLFSIEDFPLVSDSDIPWKRLRNWVRYWDMAATDETDKNATVACWTSGTLMAQDKLTKVCYVIDVCRKQYKPSKLHEMLVEIAHLDREFIRSLPGPSSDVDIWMEQEPGSTGVDSIFGYSKDLVGFSFRGDRVTGDKLTRAKPLDTAAAQGLIRVRKACPWTKKFLGEVKRYPVGLKDQIDSTAGALSKVQNRKPFVFA